MLSIFNTHCLYCKLVSFYFFEHFFLNRLILRAANSRCFARVVTVTAAHNNLSVVLNCFSQSQLCLRFWKNSLLGVLLPVCLATSLVSTGDLPVQITVIHKC